jgi:hypothetical protein
MYRIMLKKSKVVSLMFFIVYVTLKKLTLVLVKIVKGSEIK